MKTRLLTWFAAVLLPLMVNAQGPWSAEPGKKNSANPVPLNITNPGGPVFVFPFKDAVNEPQFYFFRRALRNAERAGASAFILDMDTPGGYNYITDKIMELVRKTKIPVLTFVNPSAGSAGSLIALSTKRIYMRPDAVIGAAETIMSTGQDLDKTLKLKLDSFNTAKMRAVCEENGHNPDIAEAFMVTAKELKIGDVVIDGKETLLSLNGKEAAKIYDGKPLLAAGLVESVADVLASEKLTGPVTRVESSGFETLAFWLTTLAPLLMIGGVVGAYIEMKAPGFGIPGICSLICFALFFGGHLVAGLAGWESVVVFAIGVALVLVEIFVLPGTMVPGIIGVLLMLLSLVWAMVDHQPTGPDGSFAWPSGAQLEKPMLNLVISIVGTSIIVMILAKILPKTSLYNRFVLSTAVPGGAAITVPVVNLSVKVGDMGVANTTLRPAGKATFGSALHDVISVGTFITAGASVRVVDVDGTRVMVEQA